MSKKKKLNGFQLKQRNKQMKKNNYEKMMDGIVYRNDIVGSPVDKNEVKWVSSFTKLPYDIQKSIHTMFDENIIYSQRCHPLSHKTSLTVDGVDVVDGWYGITLTDGLRRSESIWNEYYETIDRLKKDLPKSEYLKEVSKIYINIVENTLSMYGIKKLIDNEQHTFFGEKSFGGWNGLQWIDKKKGIQWVRHTWNKYGDIHFDLSVEFGNRRPHWIYYNQVDIPSSKKLKYLDDISDGFVNKYLTNKIGDWDEDDDLTKGVMINQNIRKYRTEVN